MKSELIVQNLHSCHNTTEKNSVSLGWNKLDKNPTCTWISVARYTVITTEQFLFFQSHVCNNTRDSKAKQWDSE